MNPTGVLVFPDYPPDFRSAAPPRPPAFETVANRPVAHHVLAALEAGGVGDVVVVSSTRAAPGVTDGLSDHGTKIRLRHVTLEGTVDLGSAMERAAPLVGDAPCIVHLADGLLDEPLERLFDDRRDGGPDVLVAAHQTATPEERFSAATLKMLHIAELNPGQAGLGMAGVLALGPGGLSQIGGAPMRSGSDIDLTGIAERIGSAGGTVRVRLANTWSRCTGDSRSLLELNRIALDCLESEFRRPDNHGNRIEGRVWIDERADVRHSVIVGPVMIGAGAYIQDAYIGPYTAIGAEARIEGAEVERSIISPGASIMHIGGRLVGSVVGRDARIFRDFSLPRAMRLSVGEGTEVALC